LRFDGFPEGSVQPARVLGRVREDRGVGEALRVERGPDRAHLAVHHPARGDDVCTGSRLRNGDLPVDLERPIVVDRPLAVENPTVPVIGVLVHAEIGHHDHPLADGARQVAKRVLHDSVTIERLRADGVLRARDPEDDHRPDTEVGELTSFTKEALASVLHDSRK
jgi:hypothetical protein